MKIQHVITYAEYDPQVKANREKQLVIDRSSLLTLEGCARVLARTVSKEAKFVRLQHARYQANDL